MTAPIVSLVRCDDYEVAQVDEAVRHGIGLLGGMAAFVRPGQRVLLKPNLVRAASPQRAISTHPALVAAVARQVVEVGAKPIIVESPGGPYSAALLRMTYRKTRMDWAAEQGGAELNYDTAAALVAHPEGMVLHRLDVVQPLLEVDAVINLAKLKTHNLTLLTGAVKNLFGLVPGALKIGYHAKLQDRERFCQGLVDILTYVKPTLNIVDAVVGMEGEGPSGGDPRQIGAIVAGHDAVAVDIVSAALVGFHPLDVLTTEIARQRGLTSGRLADVSLLGEPLEALRVADFRHGIASEMDPGLVPRALRSLLKLAKVGFSDQGDAKGQGVLRAVTRGWIWEQLVATPRAGPKCIGCGYCVKHCPVEAIRLVDGLAQMDTHKCIRCYCCHELCPELAVELYKPWPGRLIMGR